MRRISYIICIVMILFNEGHAQNDHSALFVFYNVENLFDLVDDSLTADEEFTPEGEKNWTSGRYFAKIDRIARTMSAVGEWKMPEMVALCEVENRKVLNDLLEHRYFKYNDYSILHQDSPDERGIDVAFLYKPQVYCPDTVDWISVQFPFDPENTTREILYVRGVIFDTDTLHVFVNHWPSRWGGVEATKPKRAEVANTLRNYIDSLLVLYGDPNIVIAGDFNDNPADVSVYEILEAKEASSAIEPQLVNLMLDDYHKKNYGSLKYKSDWEVYDQIIVSSSLMDMSGLHIKDRQAHIFHAPFLLTTDDRYMGTKPFRTYAGPRYLDGYSDHLPVFLEFVK